VVTTIPSIALFGLLLPVLAVALGRENALLAGSDGGWARH
jgi:ABC-type proline/glycine betaine transport system permease subunit